VSDEVSRRDFLVLFGVVTIEVVNPMRLAREQTLPSQLGGNALAPGESEVSGQAAILSATLTWHNQSPAGERVRVSVSRHQDFSHPQVHAMLTEGVTSYSMVVSPSATYYWSVVPVDDEGEVSARAARGSFTTAAPDRDPEADDDNVRYAGVRSGAHWDQETPVAPSSPQQPLSPWFFRKSYDGTKPPTFEDIKAKLPVPILEAEPLMVEAYWYGWKTLMGVWLYQPYEPRDQAVANIIGYPNWNRWGSSMVWDDSFILQFARYGHPAYPFITGFDNFYARQHENGFICREADNSNREVYAQFPLNPPLFGWAEWQSFLLTGDAGRLAEVFLPIAKHYEWWLRFQRRGNGLYWTVGYGEGMDDSPRNRLMYSAMSSTTFQALAALTLSRIAKVVERPDMVDYFENEHATIGKLVNRSFWDEKHQIYNDLTQDGQFITELKPGALLKHGFIFLPMMAEIAPPDRVQALVRELLNPKSFFRSSGVPSLSADSAEYNPPTGQYWKGAVWPPTQCIVQRGLNVCGQWDVAQQLARRYLDALLMAYQKQQTITENLRPDAPVGEARDNFVGWGGIGPINDLIEYVLGFEVSAPKQTLTWRITRSDRHGIENLSIGRTKVDLLCAGRSSRTAPCRVTVTSTAPFTLAVHLNGKITTQNIRSGVTQLLV
jgi:hypothetical protein